MLDVVPLVHKYLRLSIDRDGIIIFATKRQSAFLTLAKWQEVLQVHQCIFKLFASTSDQKVVDMSADCAKEWQ